MKHVVRKHEAPEKMWKILALLFYRKPLDYIKLSIYIRTKIYSCYVYLTDVFEDFISPTTAAQTLLFTSCSKRKEVGYSRILLNTMLPRFSL